MQDTLEQPRSQTIVPRTRQMAERTVDFVLRSDRAIGQLARLMSTDYYTYTHSINVCVFGVALARQAGIDPADLKDYAVGALLHDLGKTQIDKELLTRAGPLSDERDGGDAAARDHRRADPARQHHSIARPRHGARVPAPREARRHRVSPQDRRTIGFTCSAASPRSPTPSTR